MDLLETNYNNKFNDMFRPDFDLQVDMFFENKVTPPEKMAENLDSLEYNAQITCRSHRGIDDNIIFGLLKLLYRRLSLKYWIILLLCAISLINL